MDLIFWLELLLFAALMGFSGFFSSSETALFSLDSVQLEQMRRDKHPRLGLIEQMLSQPRRLIMTILIGNEFVNVAASVISAAMVIQVLGPDRKWVNLIIMIPILLLVGEIVPKTLAIRNNVAFASVEAGPIELFARLIAPLRIAVRFVADRFITLIVGAERSRGNIVTADMVRTLAREAVGEGALDKEEAQLIDQIFDFGNMTVGDIMTPRSDMFCMPSSASIRDIVAEQRRTRHNKIPVYRENKDAVAGILHSRDLLGVDIAELARDKRALGRLLREPFFVPETKSAADLFSTFRERRLSIALAVDEYGGVAGMVTMEDLLECIFGDIPSPSEVHVDDLITDLGDNRFEVDGAIGLSVFNGHLDSNLSDEIVETLGGLLLHEHGEMPEPGAVVELDDWRFEISRVEDNRIVRVVAERFAGAPAPRDDEIPSDQPAVQTGHDVGSDDGEAS